MDLSMLSINPFALVVLVPVLNGLGKALKSSPRFSNHTIPWIVSAAGGVCYGWIEGFSAESVLIGVGMGQMAVGLHQTVVQSGQFISKNGNQPPAGPTS